MYIEKRKVTATSNYALRIQISINVRHEIGAFRYRHDKGKRDAVTQKAGRPKWA